MSFRIQCNHPSRRVSMPSARAVPLLLLAAGLASGQDISHVLVLHDSKEVTLESALSVFQKHGFTEEIATPLLEKVDKEGKAVVAQGPKGSLELVAASFKELGMACDLEEHPAAAKSAAKVAGTKLPRSKVAARESAQAEAVGASAEAASTADGATTEQAAAAAATTTAPETAAATAAEKGEALAEETAVEKEGAGAGAESTGAESTGAEEEARIAGKEPKAGAQANGQASAEAIVHSPEDAAAAGAGSSVPEGKADIAAGSANPDDDLPVEDLDHHGDDADDVPESQRLLEAKFGMQA